MGNSAGTESGSVNLSYKLPDKWDRRNGGYVDKSTVNGDKACERIVVYRAPGKVAPERLSKATTIGVGEALYVTDDLKSLRGAGTNARLFDRCGVFVPHVDP